MKNASEIQEAVRERYAAAAIKSAEDQGGACCGTGCGCDDPITADLYDPTDVAGLAAEAVTASLGCGNPLLLAELHEGETVLDLGSGAGALDERDYIAKLQAAGFVDVALEPTRVYRLEDVEDAAAQEFISGLDAGTRQRLEGSFFSAYVRARKPGDA